jgi:hypothetical protein
MKRILVISLTVLTLSNVFAQKESSHSSEIKKVTVFFQGAQVEHSKSIELKSGKQEIVFQRLTDFLDPNSVQVKAKGELTILSVRTRKNYEDLKISSGEINLLNVRKKKLEQRDLVLRDEYDVLGFDKALLLNNRDLKGNDNGLKVAELKEAFAFMHQKLTEIGARQSSIYSELEEINKELNQIEQEIISQRAKPVINYTEVIVEIDVEKSTTGEFFFSYITPKASWKPYYDMRSEGIGKPVRLEAKALVNQTSGISWDNVDLVLSTNDPYENSKEPIINPWYIGYNIYPQQRQAYTRQIPQVDYSGEKLRGEVIDASTGEPLPFARVTFPSNPNVGAVTDFDGKFEITVPANEKFVNVSFIGFNNVQLGITSPYLKFFLQPNQLELNEVVVTSDEMYYNETKKNATMSISREDIQRIPARGSRSKNKKNRSADYQAIPSANASSGVSWSSNVATVAVKKDLRTEYTIQSKFTVPSDGVNHRVQIATYELPADYEYHSVPKLDASVFLTAQVSGWEKLNLLNGESNLYFDGTYIGKTFLDVNSTKDTISLSLGKDNKIQIERTRIREKSANKVIGSRQKFEVTWEIKVRNNGGASIPIIVKDQFPITTDADIKIKLGDALEAKQDENTKILTWNFKLEAGKSKSMLFDYSIDYGAGKVLYIE